MEFTNATSDRNCLHDSAAFRAWLSRSLRDRPWDLKRKCGERFLAGGVEYTLNYMIQPIFEISFGSLKLQLLPKFSTEFEFRVMKSRYLAPSSPNLSREVEFSTQNCIPIAPIYSAKVIS